ncbi:MAG: hypothetical protein II001_05950 [Bacteroidales bacterium]|nr:hypothetical protein [Bacteroidales bacterium]
MNNYEKKGIEFFAKIHDLVRNEDLTTKDSLFEVLDHIRLKDGYHLGLKLAEKKGMGDDSWFYTYKGEDPLKNGTADIEMLREKRKYIYDDLIVEQTNMGAWQTYLLFMSPSVLPLWWHANYMGRIYFFDRDNFKGIFPFCCDPVPLKIQDIPHPSVTKRNGHFFVRCPNWNDWEGLVRDSLNVSFDKDGNISINDFKRKVLYEFHSGVCF